MPILLRPAAPGPRSRLTLPALALVSAALALALAGGCAGRYVRKTTAERVEATPARLARGAYLVGAVSACGACHTTRDGGDLAAPERKDAPLGGGNVLETLVPRMRVWVPNVTSDPATGIGRWSDDQVMRAIRDGVDDEGARLLPVMPYGSFRYMSDEDVRAVVAYLRSVPPYRLDRKPIENEVPPATRIAIEKLGVGAHAPAANVVAPPREDTVRYGEYLAHLATCADCHSLGDRGPRGPGDRFMAGSDVPFPESGEVWAPNLTPDRETGIGRATPADVKRAIRDRVRLDGKPMAEPMATLASHYAGMSDADLDAVVAWLFSLPPVKHAVPERKLDEAARARLGVR